MGMERVWSRLPAIFVPSYETLTWEMLRQAWAEVFYNVPFYDYTHLTMRYWEHDVLYRLQVTGDNAFLASVHPLPRVRVVRPKAGQRELRCTATESSPGVLVRECLGHSSSLERPRIHQFQVPK